MASHAQSSSKRPNRSAKARRDQYKRADARVLSRLLALQQSLQHRGSQPTLIFSAAVSSLQDPVDAVSTSSQGVPSGGGTLPSQLFDVDEIRRKFKHLEQQQQQLSSSLDIAYANIQWQLQYLSTQLDALSISAPEVTSPAASLHPDTDPKHIIEDLLDSATVERIRLIQAERASTLEPTISASGEASGSSQPSPSLFPSSTAAGPSDSCGSGGHFTFLNSQVVATRGSAKAASSTATRQAFPTSGHHDDQTGSSSSNTKRGSLKIGDVVRVGSSMGKTAVVSSILDSNHVAVTITDSGKQRQLPQHLLFKASV